MVQMKGRIKLKNSCPSITFISHMVQMKGQASDLLPDYVVSFISHMVQMKALTALLSSKPISCLYIPHGSDESPFWIVHACSALGLYIPHGSDESLLLLVLAMHLLSLYPTWFR